MRAAREAREREQAAARLEAGLAEARLAALRAQLEPHFLFNTLNAVSALAVRGDGEARRAGAVDAERAAARDVRRAADAGGRARRRARAARPLPRDRSGCASPTASPWRATSTPARSTRRVPAMLLQPLVENAVRHGVAREPGADDASPSARGATGDALRVEVRDGGPGFARAERIAHGGDGIGLANTRERLAQLYGGAHRLECRDLGEARGALVVVDAPVPRDDAGDAGAA